MEKYVIIGIILVVLLVLFVVFPAQQASDEQYIQNWATENGHVVAKTERCFWSLGPFWFKGKHDRVYESAMQSGRTFWFRFSLFTTDVEEYPK